MRADELRVDWGGLQYSLRRYYVDGFYTRHVAALPAGSLVLDVGGYRAEGRGQFHLTRSPCRAVSVNIASHHPVDVLGDARHLPCRTTAFDAVVCSEVLEHIVRPCAVLREIHRVLKPGGRLLASVPFLHQIHGEPHDFGRYTDTYWRGALEASGFVVIALERQGLIWSVVIDLLRAHVLSRVGGSGAARRAARGALRWGVFAWAKRVAVALDRQALAANDASARNFTTGFGIVAAKA
jgi:SAM-dependent methyltransferase